MTTQMDKARVRVRQLVSAHDELTLWDESPIQSATNAVLYGSCHDERIVYKVFERPYRKHQDERQLQWLSSSGVVPKLYPYDFEDVLVMTCLPGEMLYKAEESATPAVKSSLHRQVGVGLATMMQHAYIPGDDDNEWINPHTDDIFWNSTFETFFDTVINDSFAAIAFQKMNQPQLQQALEHLQSARSEILDQRVFMHSDDIHGANIIVYDGVLQGFFDFEMSRLGNELYLLGATLQWACLSNPTQWQPMLSGYEDARGERLSADMLRLLKLFVPFQNLIRFAEYWGSDDQPDWVWERNARERTLSQLIELLDGVDTVMRDQ
ncbi:MAG: aminoglycoside phosphotransferase family protein [Chloroflexota bacterium]